MITTKTSAELSLMRECARIVVRALTEMSDAVRPGVTTDELDAIGESVVRRSSAEPSFLNYRGFPRSVCISVNSEVVHGIPSSETVLKEGDIVSLDIGAHKDGFHGDAAWTYSVGEISPDAKRLMNVTKESLYQGIAQARPGRRVGDISSAVQTYVERNGYSVVRDLVGHGIGSKLHEDPTVPNFGKAGTGARLAPGMTICIEPMINEGKWQVETLKDRWTVVTADGKLSAHFEHMVCVTDGVPEILTLHEKE